ncbi:hypothetical protein [Roseisolibacter agri]|uniref:Uncharacterized protein n=1 Tax=Roseisolibacter agri TaxID=2014610 RepID=A0AA37Q5M5_9BACT|nr:hypothetical protein [Roseisolibacter agri]GLC25102.1 hypothetical protein rosag_16150 [Roseisolibacter agri]
MIADHSDLERLTRALAGRYAVERELGRGGTVTVESRPGSGTRLYVRLPVSGGDGAPGGPAAGRTPAQEVVS